MTRGITGGNGQGFSRCQLREFNIAMSVVCQARDAHRRVRERPRLTDLVMFLTREPAMRGEARLDSFDSFSGDELLVNTILTATNPRGHANLWIMSLVWSRGSRSKRVSGSLPIDPTVLGSGATSTLNHKVSRWRRSIRAGNAGMQLCRSGIAVPNVAQPISELPIEKDIYCILNSNPRESFLNTDSIVGHQRCQWLSSFS